MVSTTEVLAQHGQQNAATIVAAAMRVGVPVHIAAAVIAKESNGRNIYGHDNGGVYSTSALGRPADGIVTESNYREFIRRVRAGETSNGVGPAQVTWKPFFAQMERAGLKPWVPFDNIVFGLGLIRDYLAGNYTETAIQAAGRAYNGADSYGRDLVTQTRVWGERLTGAFTPATEQLKGFLMALDDKQQEFMYGAVKGLAHGQLPRAPYSNNRPGNKNYWIFPVWPALINNAATILAMLGEGRNAVDTEALAEALTPGIVEAISGLDVQPGDSAAEIVDRLHDLTAPRTLE